MYSAQIKAFKYTYKHTNYLQACKLIGTQYITSKCTPARCTLAQMFLSHGMQGHLFILSILTRGSERDLAMDNVEFIAFYIITALLLLVDYK